MNYYNNIKELLINNKITKKVKNYSINKSDLDTYYNVGKVLSEAGKHYGEGIIKEYSIKLSIEIDKKYNQSNLKRMRQFYLLIEKGAPMEHQLTWSHYKALIPLKDINKIKYYIDRIINNNITKRELEKIIKSQEYERLPEETKNKLIMKEEVNVKDLVPNPIIIRSKNNTDVVSEKVLHKLILEDIESFMKELGDSFSFIGSEYKIKIGDTYHSIDLLLFNIKYNAYVVVELKITKFKVEYISQTKKYMNYLDKNIKEITNNDSIGIIVCKKEDKYVIEYCSDERIMIREFIIK